MVYCASCGAKNPDEARICTQCGEPLYEESGERASKRSDDLCYEYDATTGKRRLSQRGIIIIGGIIILIALNQLLGMWFPEMESTVWITLFFALGVIIVLYALFIYDRER